MSTKRKNNLRDLTTRLSQTTASSTPDMAAEPKRDADDAPTPEIEATFAVEPTPEPSGSTEQTSEQQGLSSPAARPAPPPRRRRFTVDLDYSQHQALKRWGAREGVPSTEAVRALIDRLLEDEDFAHEIVQQVRATALEREELPGR